MLQHAGTNTSGEKHYVRKAQSREMSGYLVGAPALCALHILRLQRIWPHAAPCSVIFIKKSTVIQSRLLVDFAKRVGYRCVVSASVVANDNAGVTLDLVASACRKKASLLHTRHRCHCQCQTDVKADLKAFVCMKHKFPIISVRHSATTLEAWT